MNIQPITSSDREKVQDFIFNGWQEFFDPGEKKIALSRRPDLQKPKEFYTERNGNFWLLKDENKNIYATIAIHEILFKGKKVGFLRRFFIDKKYRNKGSGGEILTFVEEFSRKKDWGHLIFGVDKNMERNKRFYARHGYKEFNKDIPQELIDDNDEWYLRKKL